MYKKMLFLVEVVFLLALQASYAETTMLVRDEDGRTPLHEAIEHGTDGMVQQILQKGADINVRDKEGRTPLHSALRAKNLKLAKWLVENGAQVDCVDYGGVTPLHLAVMIDYLLQNDPSIQIRDENDSTSFVHLIVEKGSDLDARDRNGRTPLYMALWAQNRNLAKWLIEKGAHVNCTDCEGMTPLLFALALFPDIEMIDFLLGHGADIHARDFFGRSVLDCPAIMDKPIVAKHLLQLGVNVNVRDVTGSSPLHKAAEVNPEIVKLLLESKAIVHAENNLGETPLHKVSELRCAALLLEYGADLNARDIAGRTALSKALLARNMQLVQFLLEKGVDIHKGDCAGETPLHLAVYMQYAEAVQLLLDRGSDPRAANSLGQTPLHIAAKEGGDLSSKISQQLLEKGADPNAVDNEGISPLHFAVMTNNVDLIRVLRMHGP